MSNNNSLAAVIDYEVECCDREEIEGAWRSLCAMMLLRTANVLGKPKCSHRKQEVVQRSTARQWVSGKVGVITFEEACHGIDLSPELTREMLERHAREGYAASINRTNPNKRVFGRSINEYPRQSDEAFTPVASCINDDV